MKSKELLDSFTDYCAAHPHERFWQALRNWCGWPFVYVSEREYMQPSSLIDTFHWEENKTP